MKTLVIIKPEAVPIADKILQELDEEFERKETFEITVDKSFVREFYSHVIEEFPYLENSLIDHFSDEKLICSVYEGENVIDEMMKRVGPTAPEKASEGTIRGDYRIDILRKARQEKRCVKNIIHRSDSEKNFNRELAIISRYR